MERLKGRRPSAPLVISILALFVALDGRAYAASRIGTDDIQNRAVAKPKLAKGAVAGSKIKNKTISSNKIKAGAVTGAKIGDGVPATATSTQPQRRAEPSLRPAVPSDEAGALARQPPPVRRAATTLRSIATSPSVRGWPRSAAATRGPLRAELSEPNSKRTPPTRSGSIQPTRPEAMPFGPSSWSCIASRIVGQHKHASGCPEQPLHEPADRRGRQWP